MYFIKGSKHLNVSVTAWCVYKNVTDYINQISYRHIYCVNWSIQTGHLSNEEDSTIVKPSLKQQI